MNNSTHFIIVGAGARGAGVYASLLSQYKQHDSGIDIVAVAEPNETRRKTFEQHHNIDKAYSFADYTPLLEKEKFADVVVIATQDADHFIPAKKAIEKGYHVLIEKPISNNLQECIALAQLAEQYPQQVIVVGHVLRYTPFFHNIKEILDSHEIGDICSINHNENIGYYHFAHSFVRGNWRTKAQSSPLILAKSCHDMDILSWLVQKPCLNVSAYGSTKHFKQSQAPIGAAKRCVECEIEQSCPYSAKKIYIEQHPSWQNFILDTPPNNEDTLKALETSPYGRCVYHCDNDVVDHMSIALEFDNEVTAVFSLSGFTNEISRTIKIMGTRGEIRGHMEEGMIEVKKFGAKSFKTISLKTDELGGHNGGDWHLIKDFCHTLKQGSLETKTSISTSLESHIMAFAVDEACTSKRQVNLQEFYNRHVN